MTEHLVVCVEDMVSRLDEAEGEEWHLGGVQSHKVLLHKVGQLRCKLDTGGTTPHHHHIQ